MLHTGGWKSDGFGHRKPCTAECTLLNSIYMKLTDAQIIYHDGSQNSSYLLMGLIDKERGT